MTIQNAKTIETDQNIAPIAVVADTESLTATSDLLEVKARRPWNKMGLLRWWLVCILESAVSIPFMLFGFKWLKAIETPELENSTIGSACFLLVSLLAVVSGSAIGKMIRSFVGERHFDWH